MTQLCLQPDILSRRYAKALFELADEQKCLDQVDNDLQRLNHLFLHMEDVRKIITSPLFTRFKKNKMMQLIVDELKAHELTKSFIGLVAKKSRLNIVPAIVVSYERMLRKFKGIEEAAVVTARNLEKDQMQSLKEQLQKMTNKKIELKHSVDASLIGGMVVYVDSKMIDNSLKNKLGRLQRVMRGGV